MDARCRNKYINKQQQYGTRIVFNWITLKYHMAIPNQHAQLKYINSLAWFFIYLLILTDRYCLMYFKMVIHVLYIKLIVTLVRVLGITKKESIISLALIH